MVSLSFVLLGMSSIIAALLMFRQPRKLTSSAKEVTSIVVISYLFITLAAFISPWLDPLDKQNRVLLQMLNNLHYFLAIPLLCSCFASIRFKKNWSKAAWGRWSLVLLALFELFRRAELGSSYGQMIAIAFPLTIAICLLYQLQSQKIVLYIATIICSVAALSIFSEYSPTSLKNAVYSNIFLSITLILCSLSFSQQLTLEKETDS